MAWEGEDENVIAGGGQAHSDESDGTVGGIRGGRVGGQTGRDSSRFSIETGKNMPLVGDVSKYEVYYREAMEGRG